MRILRHVAATFVAVLLAAGAMVAGYEWAGGFHLDVALFYRTDPTPFLKTYLSRAQILLGLSLFANFLLGYILLVVRKKDH